MSRECVTFTVGGQVFGLDIGLIRDIRGWGSVTRVPGLPPCVVGVTHLRGALLPVVDLAMRLGWGPSPLSEAHSVLVVQLHDRSGALAVDAVGDLIVIEDASLQEPPVMTATGAHHFVEGLVPLRGHMVQILDIETLLDDDMTVALDSTD